LPPFSRRITPKGGHIDLLNSETNGTGADRWSFWQGLVSLATVTAIALVCQIPGTASFIMIPLSLLGYAIGSIIIFMTTVFLLVKKRPRRGASIFLIFLLPVLLWRPLNWVADLAHLGLTAGFGAGQLGVPAKSSGSDFAVYDWSVGLAGGPNTFLIHDVTDEIALPMDKHTRPPNSENGFGDECAGKVHRLAGHYYICTF
jgi:hypothetical protein